MQRSRRFIHSVGSGYLLVASLAVLNLVTVPFALKILGKEAFGVSAAVLQTMAFTSLFEMGVGPSLGRFIADYKDRRDDPAYGSFFKSVWLVTILQGIAVIIFAVALGGMLRDFYRIPEEWAQPFQVLLGICLSATAVNLALGPVQQLIVAHQRQDILNYCSIAANAVNTVVLLLALHRGAGIYAYGAGIWASALITKVGIIMAARRLSLFPRIHGRPFSWCLLRPVAGFAGNVMFITMGSQLITLAPTVLVSRALGMNALADWNVGTRLLTLAHQLVMRIPGASEPAFWEMHARGEFERLRFRFDQVVRVSALVAGVIGGGLIALNATFVEVWTGGRVLWNWHNDIGCAVWLVLSAMSFSWNMLPAISKKLGPMKFIYFGEGLFVMLPGLFSAPISSLFWVPWIMVLCLSCGRLIHGALRWMRDLNVPFRIVLVRVGQALGLLALLGVIAGIAGFIFGTWPARSRLAGLAVIYGLLGISAAFFWGLPEDLQVKLKERIRSKH